MADIRINSLPEETTPVAGDNVAIDGATTRRTTVEKLVIAGRPTASQAEAEAGTNPTKAMTPLTTAQAIAALAVTSGDLATVATTGAYSDLTGKPTLGTAAAEDVGFFADAAQGALADSALQPTSTIDVPSNLTALVDAPPVIKANGYRWSIFAFGGGEVERAKGTGAATADFQATMTKALGSGEKVEFPAWQYPIRSFALVSGGASFGAYVAADVNVDVECAVGAKFIAGDNFQSGGVPILANMVRCGAATALTTTSTAFSRFRWKGGTFSTEALTAAYGIGSGSGLSMLDFANYFMPKLEDVFFDAGVTTILTNKAGEGFADTGLGTHGNWGESILRCGFRGLYDVGIYGNGNAYLATLGANPLTTTNGSPVVTVAHTAHGLPTGSRVGFSGATTVGGLDLNYTQFAITVVNANSYTVTAGSNASSGATGGGSAVIATLPSSDATLTDYAGFGATVEGCEFTRCQAAATYKRNHQYLNMIRNTVTECESGLFVSPVGDFSLSEGKRVIMRGNKLLKIVARPIRVFGASVDSIIEGNIIRNFGKYLSDDGVTFTPVGASDPIAGITVGNGFESNIIGHNIISQDGNWALGTPTAGLEPTGIRIRSTGGGTANNAYIDPPRNNLIHHNQFNGVYMPFREVSTGTGNKWESNLYTGNTLPPSISALSMLIEPDTEGTFTPVLAGTVTNFSSYDLQSGYYWKHGKMVTFAAYIDLSAVTGGSGNISVSGLPIAAKATAPAAQAVSIAILASAQVTHSSASYTEFKAHISAGTTAVQLFEVGSNVILALTEARFGSNTRIAVTGSYLSD